MRRLSWRWLVFLMIFLVTNQENLDIRAYHERAQTLWSEVVERFTTAILDLNAGEFPEG